MARKKPGGSRKSSPVLGKRVSQRQRRKPGSLETPSGAEDATDSFPIVGVGASAGGLEALTLLLKHLPADSGMAFVLIQHLDPKHASQLSDLLSRASRMPILEVNDDVRVEKNHIYVISPGVSLTVSSGKLRGEPRPSTLHLPVDHFFRSLAKDRGSNAIGIVLSGTASDGTSGLQAIKAEGGITFAQEPATAKFDGMPQSAIAAGVVDFVLPPDEIAKRLTQLARHSSGVGKLEQANGGAVLSDFELHQCFQLLRTATGIDFIHYKPATIARRIHRRMVVQGFENVADYATHLRQNRVEIRALADDLLIHVTSFFRDANAFKALVEKVFPEILRNRLAQETIRIWVPGCATGEEVYSIAICLAEFLERSGLDVTVQIFGSDLTEAAIQKARTGRYPASSLAEIAPQRVARFFVKADGGYRVIKSIRDCCIFAVHDITKDPPFQKLDVVSCCNVMIYLGPVLQRKALSAFHYALKPTGFLLLGSSESVGPHSDLFRQVDKKLKLYAKQPGGLAADIQQSMGGPSWENRQTTGGSGTGELVLGFDVHKLVDRMLLAEYAPAAVIVDDAMRIVQVRGHTGPYLELAPGEPSHNLLKMAREGLVVGLQTAFNKSKETKTAVVQEARVKYNEDFKDIKLRVVPLTSAAQSDASLFLVLFEEVKPTAEPTSVRSGKQQSDKTAKLSKNEEGRRDREIVRLKQELSATRAYMQSIIEEEEAAREELKSANEEARASNEELETSKEELQSTNEELNTANDELKSRNAELTQANADLTNVLAGLKIPLLIVGRALNIRRFSESMEPMLNLIDSDVGRSILNLKPNIDIPDLEVLLRNAINGTPSQPKELKAPDGRWYSLRILPYIGPDKHVEGALLMLLDIHAVKRALDYANAIVEAARGPLLVLTKDFRVETANRGFYETFKVTREETENRHLYDLGNGQWNIPQLREALEKVLPQATTLEDFEVEHEFDSIGRKTMLLNARELHQLPPFNRTRILLGIEDVTDRKNIEWARLEMQAQEYEAASDKALREKDAEIARIARTLLIGEVTTSIAHEINQPLAGVVTNAEAGLRWIGGDEPNVDEAKESLILIVRDANRASAVLRRIRQFVKKDSEESESLDVKEAIHEAIALARSQLLKDNIVLRLQISDDIPTVRGDRVQLQQVILNLIVNACEAMVAVTDRPRDLLVSAQRSADGAVLVGVRDSGVGVEPQQIDKIYDAFYTTKSTGVGMGLSISRSIIQAHGGRIWAAPNEGPGLSVQFSLPAETESPS